MIAARKRAEAFAPTLNEHRPARRFPINPRSMELMMVSHITPSADGATLCPICGTSFSPARRSQRTCTEACKKRLARSEKRDGNRSFSPRRLGLSQTARNRKNGTSQVIENIDGGVPVFDDLSPSSPLVFERVNQVTFKLTDGTKIRHTGGPAFAGSDQSRAVAWLMDIGWGSGRQAWAVRCRDLWFGPTTFAKAKQAATLLVRGGLEEPVSRLLNPIRFLNHQQAGLAAEGGAS